MFYANKDGEFYIERGGNGTVGSGMPIGSPSTDSCDAYVTRTVTIHESELPNNRTSKIWVIAKDLSDPPHWGNDFVEITRPPSKEEKEKVSHFGGGCSITQRPTHPDDITGFCGYYLCWLLCSAYCVRAIGKRHRLVSKGRA